MALSRRSPDGELIHPRGSWEPIHVARVLEPARRLERPRVVRVDRRLLGQRGDGIHLGGDQTRHRSHLRAVGRRWTRSQLRTILFEYIEVFYNRARHQARLGHRTRPRPTLPAEPRNSHQPVSKIAGQLHYVYRTILVTGSTPPFSIFDTHRRDLPDTLSFPSDTYEHSAHRL